MFRASSHFFVSIHTEMFFFKVKVFAKALSCGRRKRPFSENSDASNLTYNPEYITHNDNNGGLDVHLLVY